MSRIIWLVLLGLGACTTRAPDAAHDSSAAIADSGSPNAPDAYAQACRVRNTLEGHQDDCPAADVCRCMLDGTEGCPLPGVCQSAFTIPWLIAAVRVQLPDRQADTTAWDRDGTAPDPYVIFALDGTLIGETRALPNTTHGAWIPLDRFEITPHPGATFTATVLDDDGGGTFNDGFLCEWMLAAETVRVRQITCSGELGTLVVLVEPRIP